jgi:hypothetical protein
MNRTVPECRSSSVVRAWPGQATGAVLARGPIANIIQGANVDRRRSDNPFDPREPSRDSLR